MQHRIAHGLHVGYLGRRFEFFQRRFAPEGVPTLINSVPSRSRRALFGTRFVDPPYTPPQKPIPKNIKKTCKNPKNLSISSGDSLLLRSNSNQSCSRQISTSSIWNTSCWPPLYPPSGAYSQKPPKILKISVFPAAIRSRRCSNSDQQCSRQISTSSIWNTSCWPPPIPPLGSLQPKTSKNPKIFFFYFSNLFQK